MRNCIYALLLTLSVAFLTSCARRQQVSGPSDFSASAKALVELLAKDDFAGVAKDFDSTMKAALPPDKLEQAWKSVVGQVGPFQKQVSTRSQETPPHHIVIVTCQFERAAVDIKVVFNDAGQVSGLWFAPG